VISADAALALLIEQFQADMHDALTGFDTGSHVQVDRIKRDEQDLNATAQSAAMRSVPGV
jgi:hypothetical protein